MKTVALLFLAFLHFGLFADVRASSIESAESATTRNDVFSLRTAVQAYLTEYGYYPPRDISVILRLLQGEDINGYNWRKIVFWEARPTKKGWFKTFPGSISSTGEFIDGWGRPFVVDIAPATGLIEVWSRGKDGTLTKEQSLQRNYLAVIMK